MGDLPGRVDESRLLAPGCRAASSAPGPMDGAVPPAARLCFAPWRQNRSGSGESRRKSGPAPDDLHPKYGQIPYKPRGFRPCDAVADVGQDAPGVAVRAHGRPRAGTALDLSYKKCVVVTREHGMSHLGAGAAENDATIVPSTQNLRQNDEEFMRYYHKVREELQIRGG